MRSQPPCLRGLYHAPGANVRALGKYDHTGKAARYLTVTVNLTIQISRVKLIITLNNALSGIVCGQKKPETRKYLVFYSVGTDAQETLGHSGGVWGRKEFLRLA